jgi:hypothetical protein
MLKFLWIKSSHIKQKIRPINIVIYSVRKLMQQYTEQDGKDDFHCDNFLMTKSQIMIHRMEWICFNIKLYAFFAGPFTHSVKNTRINWKCFLYNIKIICFLNMDSMKTSYNLVNKCNYIIFFKVKRALIK